MHSWLKRQVSAVFIVSMIAIIFGSVHLALKLVPLHIRHADGEKCEKVQIGDQGIMQMLHVCEE